jgi:HJR/Mrr/RecB family endonuclease
MSEDLTRSDRWLLKLGEHLNGRSALLLASSIYAGLGLVLPLALHASTVWLVLANVLAVVYAYIVLTAWFGARVIAARRRHLLEWTSELRNLNSHEFEWLVAELFKREDFEDIRWVGQQNRGDGNVDIRARRGGKPYLIQCKRWTANLVGVNDIRGFVGTLTREGVPASQGIFVTLSQYSDAALAEGKATGLTLVDGVALGDRISAARRPEPCGECGAPMVLKHSPFGWWFRCRAPGCKGKRDLGPDAGRVVELLLASE